MCQKGMRAGEVSMRGVFSRERSELARAAFFRRLLDLL
jgi:hypothetical protein